LKFEISAAELKSDSKNDSSAGKRAFLKRGSSSKYDPAQAARNTKQYRYYADNFEAAKTPEIKTVEKVENVEKAEKTMTAPGITKSVSKQTHESLPTFDEVKRQKQAERPARRQVSVPTAKTPKSQGKKTPVDGKNKSYQTVFKKDQKTDEKKIQTQIQIERSSILEFERLERECMGSSIKPVFESVNESVVSQRIESLEARLQELVCE